MALIDTTQVPTPWDVDELGDNDEENAKWFKEKALEMKIDEKELEKIPTNGKSKWDNLYWFVNVLGFSGNAFQLFGLNESRQVYNSSNEITELMGKLAHWDNDMDKNIKSLKELIETAKKSVECTSSISDDDGWFQVGVNKLMEWFSNTKPPLNKQEINQMESMLNKLTNSQQEVSEEITTIKNSFQEYIAKIDEEFQNKAKQVANEHMKKLFILNTLALCNEGFQLYRTHETLKEYYNIKNKQYEIILKEEDIKKIEKDLNDIYSYNKKFINLINEMINDYINPKNDAYNEGTWKCYKCKKLIDTPFCGNCGIKNETISKNACDFGLKKLQNINKMMSERVNELREYINNLKIKGSKEEQKLNDIKQQCVTRGINCSIASIQTGLSVASFWSHLSTLSQGYGIVLSATFAGFALANGYQYKEANNCLIQLMKELQQIDEYRDKLSHIRNDIETAMIKDDKLDSLLT